MAETRWQLGLKIHFSLAGRSSLEGWPWQLDIDYKMEERSWRLLYSPGLQSSLFCGGFRRACRTTTITINSITIDPATGKLRYNCKPRMWKIKVGPHTEHSRAYVSLYNRIIAMCVPNHPMCHTVPDSVFFRRCYRCCCVQACTLMYHHFLLGPFMVCLVVVHKIDSLLAKLRPEV